jgi:hypothetical protein
MNITLSIHQTKSISVSEMSGEKAQWLDINLMDNAGRVQNITIFDVTLRMLQEAILNATMPKDETDEENE